MKPKILITHGRKSFDSYDTEIKILKRTIKEKVLGNKNKDIEVIVTDFDNILFLDVCYFDYIIVIVDSFIHENIINKLKITSNIYLVDECKYDVSLKCKYLSKYTLITKNSKQNLWLSVLPTKIVKVNIFDKNISKLKLNEVFWRINRYLEREYK